MASYEVKESELDALRGKTVLIVGAATGIGRSTVLLAHRKYYNPPAFSMSSSRAWMGQRGPDG